MAEQVRSLTDELRRLNTEQRQDLPAASPLGVSRPSATGGRKQFVDSIRGTGQCRRLWGGGLGLSLIAASGLWAQGFQPPIPKTWDEAKLRRQILPLAETPFVPELVPAEYYYRVPERVIYRSYPIYAPGREPVGYLETLRNREPEIVFDPAKLVTKEDWIHAGELVFDAANSYGGATLERNLRDPEFLSATRMPVTKDGVIPYFRYEVTKRGEIRIGQFGCFTCHTKVLPDGTIVKGAQGDLPQGAMSAWSIRKGRQDAARLAALRLSYYDYGLPWRNPNPISRVDTMSFDELAALREAAIPGVQSRSNTSIFFPPSVPDLFNLQDRRFLDHAGLLRHDEAGDLMRYAALNQGMHELTSYDGYIPEVPDNRTRPAPEKFRTTRYSDAQLFALVQYLYASAPPPNPNRQSTLTRSGEQIFQREKCATCHPAPIYSNNKLVMAPGFVMPADHPARADVLRVSIGTDPGLAMQTLRGTGFYKVPSLRHLWLRGPFEHNGSVMSLNDWFDSGRLRDNYVPTGFRGARPVRAIRGHEFGLRLKPEETKALIAFLMTL